MLTWPPASLASQAATLSYPALQQVWHRFQRSPFSASILARVAMVEGLCQCKELHKAASEVKSVLADWHAGLPRLEPSLLKSPLPLMMQGQRQESKARRHMMGACHSVVHAAERAGEHTLLQSVMDCMSQVRNPVQS